MNTKTAYIAIDLHHKNSVIGHMNQAGKYIGPRQVPTEPTPLIKQVVSISAEHKQLTIEQGNLSHWMADKLKPYVDRLIICDPRHNKLISAGGSKNDETDTRHLCKLLRLGALKEIYHEQQMGERRLFYFQVKQYERFTKSLTIAKRQVTAALRNWGYNVCLSRQDYKHPESCLKAVTDRRLQAELRWKFKEIQFLASQKANQFKRLMATGQAYPEITEFQKMAGCGPVTAHTFSGYIQTPHRFSRKEQLIKFCRLAVNKYSSDGRSLRSERLCKAGHSSLKNVSYTIWKCARGSANEVSDFYHSSCERSNNPTNARLNTQRKIIKTFWILWKHNRTYNPTKFNSSPMRNSTH